MINAQDILKLGFKGKQIGEIIQQSKSWTSEEIESFLATGIKPIRQKVQMVPGSVWEWLCTNQCFTSLFSRDTGSGLASNSEKRRWLEQGNVRINFEFPKPDDIRDTNLFDLVFFPGGKFQCTMI